jgi:hypothetical protein
LATALQKAAARKNIKKAQAALRRKRGGRTTTMASKAKRAGGRRRNFTLPVAAMLGFVPLAANIIDQVRYNGIAGLRDYVPRTIIPYDFQTKQWTMAYLGWGLWPILGGFAVHYLVGNKLGVNRMLARARVPLLRL